jgi:predicted transcriptional regulator of viral defense system
MSNSVVERDLAGLPSAFTRRAALAAGLTRSDLDRLSTAGVLDRIEPGCYVKTSAGPLDLDLVEAALRAPLATLCLASALAHHDLTDDIPPAVHLALPRLTHRPVRPVTAVWHWFEPSTFDLGREELAIAPGVAIGVYDDRRTIVDAFNPRLGMPAEQAISALRVWLRRQGAQPSALLALAEHWPHARAGLLRTLQVLL